VAVAAVLDDNDNTVACHLRPRVLPPFTDVGCSSHRLLDSPFCSDKISAIGLGFGSDRGWFQRVTHLGLDEMFLALNASLHSWNRPFLCKRTFLILITGASFEIAFF
jgi:hypothetical protein